MKENIIQENITRTEPAAVVMSEIPLEDLFNDDDKEFVEKGLNDAETKEVQAKEVVTTEVTTVEVAPKDDEDGNVITKQVFTTKTTTTVVKDGK